MKPISSRKRTSVWRFSHPVRLAVALTPLGLFSVSAQAADKPDAATKTVLLRFKASATVDAKARLLTKVGGQITKTYSTGWALAKVADADAALKLFKIAPEVAAAQLDYYVKLPNPIPEDTSSQGQNNVNASSTQKISSPNDPYYSQMWNLKKIGAPQAWKLTTGSSNVVVAVMDTGVRTTHEDLKNNLWDNQAELKGKPGVDDDKNGYIDDIYGWNSVDSNGDVTDKNFHGSHVTGIIGGVGNNGKGVTGINWKVKVVTVRAIMGAHELTNLSHSIIEGIDYLLKLKKKGVNVRAVNCSFGFSSDEAKAVFDSFKALSAANILIVTAAGNISQNNDLLSDYPATFDLPNLISVGASTYADERADFSSYGLKTVPIFAPGRAIMSTVNTSDSAYQPYTGTSQAAPQVTGSAALLWAVQPQLTAQQMKQRLLASATQVQALRPFVKDGKRLNLGGLLDNAVHRISGITLASVHGIIQPVGGVHIYLDGNTATPAAVTNSSGRFMISGIKGGLHMVRAQLPGLTFPGWTSVSLPTAKTAPPKTVSVVFTAKAEISHLYSIFGTVEQKIPHQDNRPKAGVDIYINDGTQPLARSDANGNFKITGLAASAYVIRAIDSATGQVAPNVLYAFLPVTQPKGPDFPHAPNVDAGFVFPFQDDLAPVVYNTNIEDGDTYSRADLPTRYTGTIKDNIEVASLEVRLFRALPDYSVIEVYDGATKTWKDFFEGNNVALTLDVIPGMGRSQFDFDIPLPNYYKPGYLYDLYYKATDPSGNLSDLDQYFYLDESDSSAPSGSVTKPSAASKPDAPVKPDPADKPKTLPPSVNYG